MILDYIIKFHVQDILNILSENDTLGYFSIKIDFLKLFESYPDVGDKVLCEPIESLPACNEDVIKAQQNLIELDEYKELILNLEYFCLKRNVHARFFGLPVCPELHRTVFPKNVDLGCFLKVTGTIVRVTQAKMLEYQRKYVCAKCQFENYVEAEFENRYILKAPTKCRNEQKCKSTTFTRVDLVSREHCKDYQEIKIQEQVNKLSIGSIPGAMWVVLENDLVDCCKPGDDVIICGTVRRRWRPSVQTKKSEVELVLQANYLEVSNSQRSEVVSSAPDIKECFDEFWEKYKECPIKGRDQILMGVCPQVYGLQLVKLAVLLTVITGSNHVVEDVDKNKSQEDGHATRVRGQCHLLLVGDPGTGKSQLLRAGVDLTARSVFTSGAGSTKAGLTCAALREEGEWQLEAGALVLSDGGVCCIDEISQLREHDRTAIHEAMEQQTISIAKAGIVCKLNTRCAIIAACNPKGHYQTDQPLSVNVSLGTPLLSRFDLIFILLDSKNKCWDKLVSSYILYGEVNSTQDREKKKHWNVEKLQMYISLVGPRCTQMTKTANTILQCYYMMQRKAEYRDPSRTTVRMLDSLVRLSQAHCRLMYRTTILPMDAIVAVSLVDLSMQDCTSDDTVDALHSTFQKHPDFHYLCLAKNLLTRLNLYEIWQNELLYYGKLLQIDHKTLETDIENGNPRIFSKYEEVTDDSIPLSASLVTSSYFNNKKTKENNLKFSDKENDKIDEDNNNKEVDNKLAATLKKHSNLNKDVIKPPIVQKKTNKRKRKEVTVDISSVQKKVKKNKIKILSKDDNDQVSENFENAKDILPAVPSVNDIFDDLGIDFNFGNYGPESNKNRNSLNNSNCTKEKENHDKVIECSRENVSNGSKSRNIVETHKTIEEKSYINKASTSKEAPSISVKDRLAKFTLNKSHDYEKYEEKSIKKDSPVKSVQRLNSLKGSCNTSSEKPSQSSQISIFESSDCDIDLDI